MALTGVLGGNGGKLITQDVFSTFRNSNRSAIVECDSVAMERVGSPFRFHWALLISTAADTQVDSAQRSARFPEDYSEKKMNPPQGFFRGLILMNVNLIVK